MADNYLGLDGIEFIEFATQNPEPLRQLFTNMGFSLAKHHRDRKLELYIQNDIRFLLNFQPGSFANRFASQHGPSVCSMGWRVEDAATAAKVAQERGAKASTESELSTKAGKVPALVGIGESLIYLISGPRTLELYDQMGFVDAKDAKPVPDKGFLYIDHLTNNVPEGAMDGLAKFYKEVFGFTEIRYFDIRGSKTGLTSFALRSPCGKFSIPINQGTEHASQINEYLREYKGAGVQHIALASKDILTSVEALQSTSVETLDIDPSYYDSVFDRVPNVKEDKQRIEKDKILVDGDDKGYLLQIFTKNVMGPIFFEFIQRANNESFGEGNFGALFRSIERDQERRGVL